MSPDANAAATLAVGQIIADAFDRGESLTEHEVERRFREQYPTLFADMAARITGRMRTNHAALGGTA